MDNTYWLVRSPSRSRENRLKWVDGCDGYFSQLQVNFIRVHDNLVKDPSNNNKSIIISEH